jgi:Acetyltransferase (GNAT) domain
MAIVVRSADLDLDRQTLIESHYQYLTKQSDDRRFDWLYKHNPYGPARVWIAFDEKTEMVIGTAAAFPRKMRVCGENLLGWILSDFCIREDFRSLGPALLLQRACLSLVQEGEMPFCYDYPSSRMLAIYKRLGVPPFGAMVRFVKPLRIDRKVGEILGDGVLARVLSAGGNLALALRDRRRRIAKGYTILSHEGRFGDEFSRLFQRVASRYRVCGHRMATYLNWRYLDNPLRRYEVLTVRRDGELLVYAVFTHMDREAVLADVFGEGSPEIIEELLAAVAAILRQRRVVSINAPVLDSHPIIPVLQRVGFYPREQTPVVVCTRPNEPLAGVVLQKKNWFLTHGDRDG